MSLTNAFQSLQPLQARWSQLAVRERNLLGLAATLVLATLLWQLGVAPALATLRTADAQATALDAQFQHLQTLQLQARGLQKQPVLSYDDAMRALTTATKQTLGTTAQLSMAGERATVTLQGASAGALAQWLIQARLNARAVPTEARLVRAASVEGAAWNGTLVMSLPTR